MSVAPVTFSSLDSTGLILTIVWTLGKGSTWGALSTSIGTLVAHQNGRNVMEVSNDGGSARNHDLSAVFTMASPLFANQPVTLSGLPQGYISDGTNQTAALNGDALMTNGSAVPPPDHGFVVIRHVARRAGRM